jgi:hypothetical protein
MLAHAFRSFSIHLTIPTEAISRCAKSMSAMIDDAASFEGIFDDLQQFEAEEQAGHAEQQCADDLLSDAGGSVASEGLSCPWLTCLRFVRKAHRC